MEKLKNRLVLKPSGLNSHFQGENLPFDGYIELMQEVIRKSRMDLKDNDSDIIVKANSPFSRAPSHKTQVKNGVLLIHGLFDSPFYLQDLGEFFVEKNFLVHSILLPGHGTVPGDLLDIDYREWIKAVRYGINKLNEQVENIYLLGYSLGGLLALQHVLQAQKSNIKAMMLFAPALKPQSRLKYLLARYHKIFSWAGQDSKWYQIKEANSFTKYSSFPFNAGYQACQVLGTVEPNLKQKQIEIPFFIAMSTDDETVEGNEIINFFKKQQNPLNKLLIYTNDNLSLQDKRIIVRASHFPSLKIINFSHSCLTVSPDNILFGQTSQFLDLQHYSNGHKISKNDLYLGAASKNNLKKHLISRLSYNPDFRNLLQNIDEFISKLN